MAWWEYERTEEAYYVRSKIPGRKKRKKKILVQPLGAKIRGIGFIVKYVGTGRVIIKLAASSKQFEVDYDNLTSVENAQERAGMELGGFRWTPRARKDLRALDDFD